MEHLRQLANQVQATKVPEYNAMTLSTVDRRGFPRSRIVLFKALMDEGVSFYTNYESDKGHEIEHLSQVALNIFWPVQYIQVRIEGKVSKISRQESEKYFSQRARLSQIGAWASHQSQELSSHQEFLDKVQVYEKKFENKEVPCPPHWGGYLVQPQYFEFWFGRDGRLHERYIYEADQVNSSTQAIESWKNKILSP